MKKIEIFDPAMCCSTGVCGPSIDSDLMRIASLVNSLKEGGFDISRHGLSDEPQVFVSNKTISEILQKEGAEILPVTLIDGEVAKTKAYPTNEELSEWLNIRIYTAPPNRGGGCCGGGSRGGC